MASKTDETPQREEVLEKPLEPPSDIPLLDLSDPAVGNLIRSAKKRGYVTHDQINSVLTSEELNSEQMDDVLAGVNVVEIEEASDDGEEPDEEADGQAEDESG
jgi:RNA polymerase primary sigma factor